MNSQLSYWFWIVHSDCYRFTKSDAFSFPVHNNYSNACYSTLADRLLESYNDNSVVQTKVARNELTTQELQFYPVKSKHIIDEIDKVLAEHYGFNEEELDFIINYDIKYRMGENLNQDYVN